MDITVAQKEAQKRIEIFCCYAREDQLLLDNLKKHLIPLQQGGLIKLWADTDINAGAEWEKEIHLHLNTAQIILLLISSDFMASNYCYSIEMQGALERHAKNEACVIPVILRPVSWDQTPLRKLQVLPTDARPIISSKWVYSDEGFVDAAEGIRKTVEALLAEQVEQTRVPLPTEATLPKLTAQPGTFSTSLPFRPGAPVTVEPTKSSAIQHLVLVSLAGLVILASGIVWFASHQTYPAGVITEISVPTFGSQPNGITAGPDGNLWFTEYDGDKVGHTTPSGSITEISVPTSGSRPNEITAGPDGNLWFTEYDGDKIGRITPSGSITEFPVPTSGSQPYGITAGPDGNLWFAEYDGDKIGRITPSGSITEFPVPTSGSQPNMITAGHDGNLWFAEFLGNKIGRITPSGSITEFPVPTSGSKPYGITAGPDGNLWFTEYSGNKIGRITPSGSITDSPIPTSRSKLYGITAGHDGNLWFIEVHGDKIGRITPSGSITEFPVPTPGSEPDMITTGLDGNLWFTEYDGDKIGRITSGK